MNDTIGKIPIKIRKKPVIVDAIRFCGDNTDACIKFAETYAAISGYGIVVNSLDGNVLCEKGNWIVKGVRGEFYTIRDDILRETCDIVE